MADSNTFSKAGTLTKPCRDEAGCAAANRKNPAHTKRYEPDFARIAGNGKFSKAPKKNKIGERSLFIIARNRHHFFRRNLRFQARPDARSRPSSARL